MIKYAKILKYCFLFYKVADDLLAELVEAKNSTDNNEIIAALDELAILFKKLKSKEQEFAKLEFYGYGSDWAKKFHNEFTDYYDKFKNISIKFRNVWYDYGTDEIDNFVQDLDEQVDEISLKFNQFAMPSTGPEEKITDVQEEESKKDIFGEDDEGIAELIQDKGVKQEKDIADEFLEAQEAKQRSRKKEMDLDESKNTLNEQEAKQKTWYRKFRRKRAQDIGPLNPFDTVGPAAKSMTRAEFGKQDKEKRKELLSNWRTLLNSTERFIMQALKGDKDYRNASPEKISELIKFKTDQYFSPDVIKQHDEELLKYNRLLYESELIDLRQYNKEIKRRENPEKMLARKERYYKTPKRQETAAEAIRKYETSEEGKARRKRWKEERMRRLKELSNPARPTVVKR